MIDFITVPLVSTQKQTERTVPLATVSSLWLVVGELFEDVGYLAEIFFVGVGGTFEDGGLRNYLFAN